MKKVVWLLMSLGLLTACMDGVETDPNAKSNETKVKALQTSMTYAVDVKAGCVTNVGIKLANANGEADTVFIAEIVKATSILVPKDAEIVKVYTPVDQYPNIPLVNTAKAFQVVCFEDSRKGDYDYNDLVIHVKYETKGNQFAFGVQPIALGSVKDVYLGCVVTYQGKELFNGLLFNQTAREKYFEGKTGFINTCKVDVIPLYNNSKTYSDVHKFTINTSVNEIPRVEWFIQVDGKTRLYALSTKYSTDSFDAEGLPYGIVVTNTGLIHYQGNVKCGYDWFNYPYETISMAEAYPMIWNWLKGNGTFNFSTFYKDEVNDQVFPAARKGLYMIQNDVDLFE